MRNTWTQRKAGIGWPRLSDGEAIASQNPSVYTVEQERRHGYYIQLDKEVRAYIHKEGGGIILYGCNYIQQEAGLANLGRSSL